MRLNPFKRPAVELERQVAPTLNFNAYLDLLNSFGYGGTRYFYPESPQSELGPSYGSLAAGAYKQNGIVFACLLTRMSLFSEARFQFQAMNSGRPGDLFGTSDLDVLEHPWPGATTGDLLTKMIQYADLAGNAYAVRMGDRIRVLRPDWVSIVIGSDSPLKPESQLWDPDAVVVGYMYQPGGPGSDRPPVSFLAEEVAHFAPVPDPEAQFRGMSWLTPVIREVMWDKAATDFKLRFFENAATPQLAIKLDVPDIEQMREWIDMFKADHEGAANAHRTMYLGAGADVTPLSHSFEQIQLKETQGAGETRIAAAAGVPPVIVGLSEGLEAATYSNYSQARRRLVDGTMRPLWRNISGSLERIVPPPRGQARLWYDDRDIPFLRDDQLDVAEVQARQSAAMGSLVAAGFEPGSVVNAIASADMTLLQHTGLVSVQLLPPGQATEPGTQPTQDQQPQDNGQPPQRSAELVESLLRMAIEQRRPLPPALAEGAITIRNEMPPTHVNVEPAQVNVEPTHVNIEPAQVTVEPARVEVPVTVEAAQVTVEPANVEVPITVLPAKVENRVEVQPADVKIPVVVQPADVQVPVNVEMVDGKVRKRTVAFGDGRTATVTDEPARKKIEFDDGRTAIVTEEEENDE